MHTSSLFALACAAVWAGGCGSSTKGGDTAHVAPPSSAPADQASPPQEPQEVAPGPANDCPPVEGDAEAAYAELNAMDANAEWSERLAAARKAARAGHPEGQARAGGMMFAGRFQAEAPDPEGADDRDAYIEALTLLFTGALRGSEFARGWTSDVAAIADSGQLPDELSMPLADVPREWVEAALSAAQTLAACYEP